MTTKTKPKTFKIGTRVSFIRRNGHSAEGRVAGTDDECNGTWISVNTAGRGQNARLTSLRPSQLTRI